MYTRFIGPKREKAVSFMLLKHKEENIILLIKNWCYFPMLLKIEGEGDARYERVAEKANHSSGPLFCNVPL